ncbi:MAG: DUF3488 domain-containing protein [Pirellulales bacterium]|nr:DUF3488 domain-containing protein [Pirellulales bacterium]
MAALAAMGTVLLGMGQREEVLPLVMCLAAAGSVWLTDIKGVFRLSRTWANFAMLAVALISLPSLYLYLFRRQDVAMDFARFLIYLQIILLFQKKSNRIYWQLLMLSMLQVLVGSLSGPGVFFGFLLVVYMLAAMLGLALMLLGRYAAETGTPLVSVEKPPDHSKKLAASPFLRWPWIDWRPQLTGVPAESGRQGVGRELFERLLRMSFFTLGLTLVLFILLPRFGQFGVTGAAFRTQRMVGFSSRVTLGELGQLIEDPSGVLRVRFFDHATNAPYLTQGDVYLRGAVQSIYKNREWKVGSPSSMPGSRQLEPTDGLLPKDLVRQECTIEGLNRSELFYVAPLVPLTSRKDVAGLEYDDQFIRLRRDINLSTQRFSYRLGTTVFRDGRQLPLVPTDPCEKLSGARQSPPKERFPELIKLAQTWIDQSGLSPEKRFERAKYLEQKFATSGLFLSSMEEQPRDPRLDPIEDFVSRHRAGHCEYFASALALMLRSQKIPARLVTGFKCDEWNQFGQCYEVRNLHAHAWVEAYLRPSQIPPELLHGEDKWPWKTHGGWLQLDPTPLREDSTKTSFFAPVLSAYRWVDHAWSYYVVELTYQRQRDSIYRPLIAGAKRAYAAVASPNTWRGVLDALHLRALPFWIKGLLLIVLGLLAMTALSGLGWLAYQIGRRWRRRWHGHPAAKRHRARAEVEFYRRLEQLLTRFGLTRAAGQTPREFALAAGRRLATTTGQVHLALLPPLIVEAFYRVRFGLLPLDNSQSEAVEQALAQIKEIVGGGSRRRL